MTEAPWVGVDFDGTLAVHDGHAPLGVDRGPLPVPAMVRRVRNWLSRGVTVKIVTARMADPETRAVQRELIQIWCQHWLGYTLEVQAHKSYGMVALYDDRAVQVETNTGRVLGQEPEWTR